MVGLHARKRTPAEWGQLPCVINACAQAGNLRRAEEWIQEMATQMSVSVGAVEAIVERLHEQNPMLGTRGVRLAIVRDGLYRMQVKSLLQAIAVRVAAGGTPLVGIMIPLVSDVAELADRKRHV